LIKLSVGSPNAGRFQWMRSVSQYDPEVHDVLMEQVFPRQAHVATVAELPALFRQHR
jgi:hypothetical protein